MADGGAGDRGVALDEQQQVGRAPADLAAKPPAKSAAPPSPGSSPQPAEVHRLAARGLRASSSAIGGCRERQPPDTRRDLAHRRPPQALAVRAASRRTGVVELLDVGVVEPVERDLPAGVLDGVGLDRQQAAAVEDRVRRACRPTWPGSSRGMCTRRAPAMSCGPSSASPCGPDIAVRASGATGVRMSRAADTHAIPLVRERARQRGREPPARGAEAGPGIDAAGREDRAARAAAAAARGARPCARTRAADGAHGRGGAARGPPPRSAGAGAGSRRTRDGGRAASCRAPTAVSGAATSRASGTRASRAPRRDRRVLAPVGRDEQRHAQLGVAVEQALDAARARRRSRSPPAS